MQNVDNGDDIAMNEFRTPNTTNLHTHGFHVSSASPGDDIFYEVRRREGWKRSLARRASSRARGSIAPRA